MIKLAYIPDTRKVSLAGVPGVLERNARFWRGEVEPCDVVMVHPRCSNINEIERAYGVSGIHVEPWNLPDANDPPSVQTVLHDGMWKGEDVIIVGGGPSLRDFDWHRLDECGCKVIAINRAYEYVTNPTIVYGMDNRFFTWANRGEWGEESLAKWNAITCPIICSTLRETNGSPRCVHINRSQDPNSDSIKRGVYCGGNSGMGAIHLCSLLGARRVYLLGYDCLPSDNGKTAHFHTGYNDDQRCEVYERFRSTFNSMANRMLKKMEITNCNPASGVKCFPFGNMPDGPLNCTPADIPMIVTYVTPDYMPVYEKHLKPGLERFGLRHILIERESAGDWKRNAAQKATVFAEAYAEHGQRGLVWIDADASIERLPVLFAGLAARSDIDFAAHWLPSGEMLSSVVYFGGTDKARDLVNAWRKRCEGHPVRFSTADQMHLQNVIENFVCNDVRLPASYCKIFDHKEHASVTHPAIVQHQASRQFRKSRGNK